MTHELVQSWRSAGFNKPIIILTWSMDSKVLKVSDMIDAGANHVVIKEELLDLIDQLLPT
ncbi:hypothetical protein ACFLZY_02150 [Patescibacteria group bacterium]